MDFGANGIVTPKAALSPKGVNGSFRPGCARVVSSRCDFFWFGREPKSDQAGHQRRAFLLRKRHDPAVWKRSTYRILDDLHCV
jgi:hypothetical protein